MICISTRVVRSGKVVDVIRIIVGCLCVALETTKILSGPTAMENWVKDGCIYR